MFGTIKMIAREKGFGFIRDESGQEWFFHRSNVEPAGGFDRLNERDQIEFTPTKSPKGPRAEEVRAV